jgi:hypothetical protein
MLLASKNQGILTIAIDQVYQIPFNDLADNIDKDLSRVPEDYGKLENTKKTQTSVKGLLGLVSFRVVNGSGRTLKLSQPMG